MNCKDAQPAPLLIVLSDKENALRYFLSLILLVKDLKNNNNVEKQKLVNIATPTAFFPFMSQLPHPV